ncbi:glycosyltransferase family 2 protein [Lactobacillus johnsonii]|uniref:glycosyltransferase family 2 protein n=1 Tax=Lactobacillus johnsonii TaxID=33959 RepID=UPI0028FC1B10|nr:glycosyltransferase family 2 protein [Lactobacillus johnsonii]WNW29148.1 glycosyltransferase family 2 protein [Lactobacillus johnsonii]
MDDISVITPVYKGNKYLPTLLHVIEKAADRIKPHKVNWILVNDSPTIKLVSLNTNLKNLKITKIENSHNLGIQKSRIVGLNHATSKYIMFLDQDDKIESSALKIHLLNIKNSDVSITNGYEINSSEHTKEKFFNKFAEMNVLKKLPYYFYLGNFIISPGMTLIRRSAIPDVWKETNLKINGADDWLLWVLMLCKGSIFSLNFEPTYSHMRNDKNVSNNVENMIDSTYEALNVFCKEYPQKKRLYKIGKRRLEFWKDLQVNGSNKYKLYLLNPDIAFYAIKKKMLRIF